MRAILLDRDKLPVSGLTPVGDATSRCGADLPAQGRRVSARWLAAALAGTAALLLAPSEQPCH